MGRGRAMLYISIKTADWECGETRTELGKNNMHKSGPGQQSAKQSGQTGLNDCLNSNDYELHIYRDLNALFKVVMKIPVP